MNMFWARHSTDRNRSGGTTIQPSRQPVMLKYFEKLFTRITCPPSPAALAAGPS